MKLDFDHSIQCSISVGKFFNVPYMLSKDIIKRRLDEITKVNLYDIGLSEEELKRRKAKKLCCI